MTVGLSQPRACGVGGGSAMGIVAVEGGPHVGEVIRRKKLRPLPHSNTYLLL
jgi:hypothetical protein